MMKPAIVSEATTIRSLQDCRGQSWWRAYKMYLNESERS